MIDDKKIEKLEKSTMKLTITVSAEKTQEIYNELIEKYTKQAQIPGFRKGRIPSEILIRKFGESIEQEATANIIDRAMQQALDDEDKKPISRPVMDEYHHIDPKRPYTFSVTYEIYPEIILGKYTQLEIEEPQVSILEKHVNEELEIIREQNSMVISKEDGIIVADSVVTMDYVELGEDGTPREETRRRNFIFTVNKNMHPYSIDSDIEGMEAGEEKSIEKIYGDDASPALAGRTINLHIKIVAVKERRIPELDDELAQDVSEDLNTLDDLKKKIMGDIQKRVDAILRVRSIDTIADVLVEDSTLEVPESMITNELERTWTRYIKKFGATEEMLINVLKDTGGSKAAMMTEWREEAERSVKVQLIFQNIIQEEGIDITDEEIIKYAGDSVIDMKNPEKTIGDKHFQEYLRNQLLLEKLYDFLLDVVCIRKGEKIDFTDFLGA